MLTTHLHSAKVTNVSAMSIFMMWCIAHRLHRTCFIHTAQVLFTAVPHSKLFLEGGFWAYGVKTTVPPNSQIYTHAK